MEIMWIIHVFTLMGKIKPLPIQYLYYSKHVLDYPLFIFKITNVLENRYYANIMEIIPR